MPPTSSPLKHPPMFKDHLATIRHESLHCMNSQAKYVTCSRAQTQISYFLKNLLCSLLFKSDSMSLFRVSFSLRSWKSRKQKREDVDCWEEISSDEDSNSPDTAPHQWGGRAGTADTAAGLPGR